jgi:hypothetical protein
MRLTPRLFALASAALLALLGGTHLFCQRFLDRLRRVFRLSILDHAACDHSLKCKPIPPRRQVCRWRSAPDVAPHFLDESVQDLGELALHRQHRLAHMHDHLDARQVHI